MINLLPPEIKQEIMYARRNTKLLRWCSAIVLVIIGTGLIVGFGYLYLNRSIKANNAQLTDTTQQLKLQNRSNQYNSTKLCMHMPIHIINAQLT